MKKFITFEGGEGSGKSTQSKLLSKSLLKIKLNNILTREPGGTKFSEKIRKLLVNANSDNISADTELLLVYAARNELLKNKIIPELKKNIVICDRFIHSTYSYQHESDNLKNKITFIHKNFAFNLMPDLTFLLDISPEKGIKRSLKIKKNETRFEKKKLDFHKKVRSNFLKMCKGNKKILIVDATLSKRNVHTQIIDYLNLKSFFKKKIPYSI